MEVYQIGRYIQGAASHVERERNSVQETALPQHLRMVERIVVTNRKKPNNAMMVIAQVII